MALTSHRNLERSQTREKKFFRNKKIIRNIFAAFDNHKKICKKPKSQINNPKKNSIPERKNKEKKYFGSRGIRTRVSSLSNVAQVSRLNHSAKSFQ